MEIAIIIIVLVAVFRKQFFQVKKSISDTLITEIRQNEYECKRELQKIFDKSIEEELFDSITDMDRKFDNLKKYKKEN